MLSSSLSPCALQTTVLQYVCAPNAPGCMDPAAWSYEPRANVHAASKCVYRYLTLCDSLCNEVRDPMHTV